MPNSKIISISEDQNVITHESGVNTNFIYTTENFENCEVCIYKQNRDCWSTCKPCDPTERNDKRWGYFVKLP